MLLLTRNSRIPILGKIFTPPKRTCHFRQLSNLPTTLGFTQFDLNNIAFLNSHAHRHTKYPLRLVIDFTKSVFKSATAYSNLTFLKLFITEQPMASTLSFRIIQFKTWYPVQYLHSNGVA